MTQEHDRVALHAVFRAAEYSFIEERDFHPPLNPLQIHLPLGKLTLNHFDMLLHSLNTELIRQRDDRGRLPIPIACRNKGPAEVLALMAEHATTLQTADHTGAMPLHECCCGAVDESSTRFLAEEGDVVTLAGALPPHLLCCSGSPTEYASVRYLVEHGGVDTLAARNHEGALPLHALCESTNPSLRTV